MARCHVKVDGSMDVCTAKEATGARVEALLTSEAEARTYSEKIVAEQSRSSNGLKKSNGDGGSKVLPTGGVSGYEGSPYAKWVSVQDQALDVDGDVKADSDELGLTKLTDPEDPMTKARHYIMRKLGCMDVDGVFGHNPGDGHWHYMACDLRHVIINPGDDCFTYK